MRFVYLTVLTLVAILLALIIRIATAPADAIVFELLALNSPTVVYHGDPHSIYAGIAVAEGQHEVRLYYCGAEDCRIGGRRTVNGPGEWWGYVGVFEASAPGLHVVELLLSYLDQSGAWRTVANHTWEIDAR